MLVLAATGLGPRREGTGPVVVAVLILVKTVLWGMCVCMKVGDGWDGPYRVCRWSAV